MLSDEEDLVHLNNKGQSAGERWSGVRHEEESKSCRKVREVWANSELLFRESTNLEFRFSRIP